MRRFVVIVGMSKFLGRANTIRVVDYRWNFTDVIMLIRMNRPANYRYNCRMLLLIRAVSCYMAFKFTIEAFQCVLLNKYIILN